MSNGGPMGSAPLIQPQDRIFVAGSRGMAGSAIVRALSAAGYGQILTPPAANSTCSMGRQFPAGLAPSNPR